MNDVEIEIQVNIERAKPLIEFLEKNAEFKSEKQQIDEYFSPAHRDFTNVRPVKEWLRLRDAGGNSSINYKNWHFDESGKSYHCDEFETRVEDLHSIRKILHVLNFQPIVKVDKLRKNWLYKDYEISIDSVKGLGDFVEIEYIGKDEDIDPKKTTQEMVDFLKNLGCGKITRNYKGYPFLLLFPDEAEYEIQ